MGSFDGNNGGDYLGAVAVSPRPVMMWTVSALLLFLMLMMLTSTVAFLSRLVTVTLVSIVAVRLMIVAWAGFMVSLAALMGSVVIAVVGRTNGRPWTFRCSN